jgi:hypothetical protein
MTCLIPKKPVLTRTIKRFRKFRYQNFTRSKTTHFKVIDNEAEGKNDTFRGNLINNLINRNRPKIKTVVDNVMKYYASRGLDYIISTAINLKMSYIEHQFYGKVEIIRYFMQTESISKDYINILNNKVLGAIE